MKGTIGFKELFIQNLTKLKIANFRKKIEKIPCRRVSQKGTILHQTPLIPLFLTHPILKHQRKQLLIDFCSIGVF